MLDLSGWLGPTNFWDSTQQPLESARWVTWGWPAMKFSTTMSHGVPVNWWCNLYDTTQSTVGFIGTFDITRKTCELIRKLSLVGRSWIRRSADASCLQGEDDFKEITKAQLEFLGMGLLGGHLLLFTMICLYICHQKKYIYIASSH